MIGYLSIPSPETTLYGIESSEHFSSISHSKKEAQNLSKTKNIS
jgi:hypothetical protein